jgi:hypothetical protein
MLHENLSRTTEPSRLDALGNSGMSIFANKRGQVANHGPLCRVTGWTPY